MLNTAVAQAYANNKISGINEANHRDRRGPMGTALSIACGSMFNMKCTVYMVRVQLPAEAVSAANLMQTYGATILAVVRATRTDFGRKVLKEQPDTTGSLGIAISEAIEVAAQERRHESSTSLGTAY